MGVRPYQDAHIIVCSGWLRSVYWTARHNRRAAPSRILMRPAWPRAEIPLAMVAAAQEGMVDLIAMTISWTNARCGGAPLPGILMGPTWRSGCAPATATTCGVDRGRSCQQSKYEYTHKA